MEYTLGFLKIKIKTINGILKSHYTTGSAIRNVIYLTLWCCTHISRLLTISAYLTQPWVHIHLCTHRQRSAHLKLSICMRNTSVCYVSGGKFRLKYFSCFVSLALPSHLFQELRKCFVVVVVVILVLVSCCYFTFIAIQLS